MDSVALDMLVRYWETFFNQHLFVGDNEDTGVPRLGLTLFHATLSNVRERYGPLDLDRGGTEGVYVSITPGHPYHVLLEKAPRLYRRTDLARLDPTNALMRVSSPSPAQVKLWLQLARAEGSVRLFEYLVTKDIPEWYGVRGDAPHIERLLAFPPDDRMGNYLTPVRTYVLDPVDVLVHHFVADDGNEKFAGMKLVDPPSVPMRRTDTTIPWPDVLTEWPPLVAALDAARWRVHVLEHVGTPDARLALYALMRAGGLGNPVLATHAAGLFAGTEPGEELVVWIEDETTPHTPFSPPIEAVEDDESMTTLTSWPAIAAFGRIHTGEMVGRAARRLGLVPDAPMWTSGFWVQCLAQLRADSNNAVADELLLAVGVEVRDFP